jgi:hypothetical protein
MRKKLEIAANLATLVVAGLLGYVLLDRYLLHKTPPSPVSIASGEKFSLPEVDWARNGRTLVLVLQKGCHFCSESAPFYKKLVEQTGQPGKPHLVAVLPQSPKEAADYLSALGVPIGDVRQARLSDVKVHGTPTLLLVGSNGVVNKVWIGKLKPEKESEVLQTL